MERASIVAGLFSSFSFLFCPKLVRPWPENRTLCYGLATVTTMALSGEHHFMSQGKNEPLHHEWYVLASTSTESFSSTWSISFSLSDYHLPDVIFALYGRHFSRQSCQGRQLPTDRGRGTRVLLQCWGRGTRAVVGQDVLPCRGKNYSCTNVIQIHARTKLEQRQATLNESWNCPCFPCWATLAPNLHAFLPLYENCCGLQLATISLEICFEERNVEEQSA